MLVTGIHQLLLWDKTEIYGLTAGVSENKSKHLVEQCIFIF